MAGFTYTHRLEHRGNGIVAVYSEGPANETALIHREGRRFARQELTFEPGLSGRPVSSSGRYFSEGRSYQAQQTFVTKKLAPRKD